MRNVIIAIFMAVAPLTAQTKPPAPTTTTAKAPVNPAGDKGQPQADLAVEMGKLQAEIGKLRAEIEELKTKTAVLELRVGGKADANRFVSLDPAAPSKYSRLETGGGSFLVSLENVEPY